MSMPRVSVVMPMFNAVSFLARSVGSLEHQTVADWELIVIDDGSTDGSADWIAARADGERIRLIQQRNAGVSAARNRGIEAARGDYIAFLDADDEWDPEFLSSMLDAMRDDVVLAYCGWQNVGLAGPRGRPFIPPDYEGPDKAISLFTACRWPIHAALTRRDAILRAGGFSADLSHAEDYALWLEVAMTGTIALVERVLAIYHFHGAAQASANRARAALQFLTAQSRFLARHPDFGQRLGRRRVREATLGTLRDRGFECYWQRDLDAARAIFRRVLRGAYLRFSDLPYTLPALLPAAIHRQLLQAFSRQPR